MAPEKSRQCVRRECVGVLRALLEAGPALQIKRHRFQFFHLREGVAAVPPQGCFSRSLTLSEHRESPRAASQNLTLQVQGIFAQPAKRRQREDPELAKRG